MHMLPSLLKACQKLQTVIFLSDDYCEPYFKYGDLLKMAEVLPKKLEFLGLSWSVEIEDSELPEFVELASRRIECTQAYG